MSVNATLMQGVNEVGMQAVINSYDLKPFYFPTLFPLKENMTLSWKALEATTGLKVAADVVARGASIPRKVREAIGKLQGEIPKIAVAREMDENTLTDYDIALALSSNNPNVKAIVEFWANDMEFCWTGVTAKLEWMALRQISTGKIIFQQDNNQSVLSEFAVDYQIPTDQKTGVAEKWSVAGSKPLNDFRKAITDAKKKSISPRFAFMNLNTFAKFSENEDVIKQSASFANVALGISQSPDLVTVNSMIAKKPWLNGLQIVVIDQDITLEINGERKTENPFLDDVVMLSERKVLGNTYWKKPIDMNLQGSSAIKVMNGPVLIKKFSTEEPVTEVTQGIANAFPAWNGSGRSVLLDVESKTGFTK